MTGVDLKLVYVEPFLFFYFMDSRIDSLVCVCLEFYRCDCRISCMCYVIVLGIHYSFPILSCQIYLLIGADFEYYFLFLFSCNELQRICTSKGR
jgi:hypothetical protein